MMNPDLGFVLQTYRKQIVQRWVELILAIPQTKYAERPVSELAASSEEALVALIEIFTSDLRGRLENYVRNLSLIRFQMGFDIEEVITAILLFKEAMFPFLCEHVKANPEKLFVHIPTIDKLMREFISEFSELFVLAYHRRLEKNLEELHEHENLLHRQNELLERNNKETQSLMNSVRIIASTLDLETVLQYILDQASDLMNSQNCILYELDETRNELILRTRKGEFVPINMTENEVNYAGRTFIKEILSGNEAVVVSDAGDPEVQRKIPVTEFLAKKNILAFLATPLIYQEEALGCLVISFDRPHKFTAVDKQLISTFSLHAALAIENARLFKRSRKAAILEERNRLAREIHDNLAQGLTALVLQLEVIDRLLLKDPTRISAELEQAKIQARSNLQEARRSVWDLRAGSDEMVSLADSIKREVEKLRLVTEIQFNFELQGTPIALAWEATSHIFRIFLESINNILQHAHARNAWIKLDFQNELLILKVIDDGVGLQSLEGKLVETKKGFGLTGMQERSRLLKAVLNINSSMGAGTTVNLAVPLRPWHKIVATHDTPSPQKMM